MRYMLWTRYLLKRKLDLIKTLSNGSTGSTGSTGSLYVLHQKGPSFSSVAAMELKPEPVLEIPKPSSSADYSPKIQSIVDQISHLNLIEVAELNQLLKKTLNIEDAPMMAMPMMATNAGGQVAEEEDVAVKASKTSFTVKLKGFDDTKKIPLIKEIKGLMEGLNLVQSKKFVESVVEHPQVIKDNLTKEDAEKLKETLEAIGGKCTIE